MNPTSHLNTLRNTPSLCPNSELWDRVEDPSLLSAPLGSLQPILIHGVFHPSPNLVCSLFCYWSYFPEKEWFLNKYPTNLPVTFQGPLKTFDDSNTKLEWQNCILVLMTNNNVDADQSNKRKTQLEFSNEMPFDDDSKSNLAENDKNADCWIEQFLFEKKP